MENKKSALQKLSDKILEWDSQLDGLKDVAKDASVDLKKEYADLIEELRVRKKDAEAKYEKIKDSSDDGWDEMKVGIEKAFNELSEGFSKAKEKFKK